MNLIIPSSSSLPSAASAVADADRKEMGAQNANAGPIANWFALSEDVRFGDGNPPSFLAQPLNEPAPETQNANADPAAKSVTPFQDRKFKDGSSPSLYLLFYQALEKALGPHKSESGHSFDYPLYDLIATFYEDEVTPQNSIRHFVSFIGFGKKLWNDYFGDIGDAPPLPHNICSILAERCPLVSGKTVAETHMLVLVPEKLNGKLMTIKLLGELIRGLGRQSYGPLMSFALHSPFAESHWVLITKDVISNGEQLYRIGKDPNYRTPTILEVATAIFMQNVVTGIHHFQKTSRQKILSRQKTPSKFCVEAPSGWLMIATGFPSPGLTVFCSPSHDPAKGGIVFARKL